MANTNKRDILDGYGILSDVTLLNLDWNTHIEKTFEHPNSFTIQIRLHYTYVILCHLVFLDKVFFSSLTHSKMYGQDWIKLYSCSCNNSSSVALNRRFMDCSVHAKSTSIKISIVPRQASDLACFLRLKSQFLRS